MSREVRRVEPLPAPFVLPDDAARRSPLHSRVIFLAMADEVAARSLLADLRTHDDVQAAPGPSRLFELGLMHPWASFHMTSDVGLAGLLTAHEFLTLLRALADDLLGPAVQPGRILVEWSPGHADPHSLAAIRSVYPDAVAVTEPTTADDVLRQLPGSSAATTDDKPSPDAMRDQLIVIVGAGRSGTTWLEELLLAYDDVGGLSGHETWLFHSLRKLWRNQTGVDGPGFGQWVDRASFVRALRAFCDGVLTAARQRHAPTERFYVEKTPAHAERLAEIAAVYPDAWVVHLLRDGRDVARSMSQVPFFDVPNIADAAALWRRVVRAVRVDAPGVPRFREVRYESLYMDPGEVLHALRDWMHAAPVRDPDALADAIGRRVSTHAGTSRPVGPDSWRSLPAADLAAVYAAAGDELVRAGYATRSQVWRARMRPAALLRQRARKSATTPANADGSSTHGK